MVPTARRSATSASYTRAPGIDLKINIANLIAAQVTDQDNDPITLQSVGSETDGATIVAGSAYIFYTAANNDNPDVFTYTVSDGQGGTATANINVAVVKGVGEARAITLTGGVATVDFAGIPGYAYDVQRSTNGMATWQVILTTNAPGDGSLESDRRLWQQPAGLGVLPGGSTLKKHLNRAGRLESRQFIAKIAVLGLTIVAQAAFLF